MEGLTSPAAATTAVAPSTRAAKPARVTIGVGSRPVRRCGTLGRLRTIAQRDSNACCGRSGRDDTTADSARSDPCQRHLIRQPGYETVALEHLLGIDRRVAIASHGDQRDGRPPAPENCRGSAPLCGASPRGLRRSTRSWCTRNGPRRPPGSQPEARRAPTGAFSPAGFAARLLSASPALAPGRVRVGRTGRVRHVPRRIAIVARETPAG